MDPIRYPRQMPEVHYWNEAVSHLNFWLDAVKTQRDRVSTSLHPAQDPLGSQRRIADAMFLLVAIYRLDRACRFASLRFEEGSTHRRRIDRLRDRFRATHPDVETLRHQTEHFDEWLLGNGHGQAPSAGA